MKKIQIYDTTLRDGTQGEGISLSLNDKLLLAKRFDQFGIDYIEGGWPGSNPKDLAFFKDVKKIKLKHSKIVAFGSTRRANSKVAQDDNIKALLEAGTKTVTVFGKAWDFHVTEVFKTSLKENLAMIRETVAYLKSKKLEVIYDAEHYFDGFREHPDYAIKTIREAALAGADMIVLCDTNGGSIPHQIAIAMKRARKAVKIPLGIHVHNDGDLAVANSMAAIEHGAIQVQGTINGYGERCGNANLTSIIPILQLKLGLKVLRPKKLQELTELSHYVAEVCNMPIENNQPFTGPSAFAHKGGVHVNAMLKNAKTYEHINPDLVGNNTRYLVSELSGKSNVLLKAKELKIELDPNTAHTKTILQKVRELENEGYQFEAAEASFELLMKRELGKHKKFRFFSVKNAEVSTEQIGEGSSQSKASVQLEIDGQVTEIKTAIGDGPVDALYRALKEALLPSYKKQLEHIHLTDYKVRVVNPREGTAAKVRVLIQFQDTEGNAWTTVGVDKNIIEASWHALVDAIEYKLLKG